MGTTPRLATAIARAFPTTTSTRAQKHIDMYRGWRDHEPKRTDWEGTWEFFQRAMTIAFQHRHKVTFFLKSERSGITESQKDQ